MNRTRTIATISLLLLLPALPGCGKKQDNAAQAPAQSVPTQPKPQQGAVVTLTPAPEEPESAAAKTRVLAHIKGAEFASIYREASAGFRQVGTEQQFLELWNRQLQETGAFKDAKEVTHGIRPTDKFQVYIYTVQYEKKPKQLRLTFGRSKQGKVELTGINQTDVKKNS